MASAIPAFSKTWTLVQNQSYATSGVAATDNQKMVLTIVNQLIAWGWTCSGSGSTGSGGARDGTNRWASISNVVTSAWIELYNSTMGIYLCIQQGSSNGTFYWQASYVGFSGGTPSATVTGTAADSFSASTAGGYPWPISNAAFSAKWHGWKSSDNYVHQIVVYVASVPVFFLRIEKPTNGVVGFPNAAICINDQGNNAGSNKCLTSGGNPIVFCGFVAAARQLFSLAKVAIGQGGPAVQSIIVVNAFDANWSITPLGVGSTTAAISGLHFWCADLWECASSLQEGATFPATGARQVVTCGDLVLPWSDVAMQVT